MAEKSEKGARRLPRKDYTKLRRLAENLDKAQRAHRDWCETQADEYEFYVDRWVLRVGYYKDDDDKRHKLPKDLTVKARARHTALTDKALALDRFILKLAEKHKTFPDLIDLKTGKVTFPKQGPLEPLPEGEDEAEEEPTEETLSESDSLGVGSD